jgi:uncharacterized protein YlxP (DUF503 family)
MIVAIARITLHLPQARSLKDKRQIVKAILQRSHNLGLAASEVDDQDVWQVAVLGFAAVSGEARQAEGLVDRVVQLIEGGPWDAWLTEIRRDDWTDT